MRPDLSSGGVGVSLVSPGFVRDAGMFADAAHALPWFVATVSPDAVAKGIVRAIRRNRSELTVAPLTLRLFAAGGSLPPVLVPMINRRLLAGDRVATEMVVATPTRPARAAAETNRG